MKSDDFFRLGEWDEVCIDDDERVYSVLATDDHMGRIQIAPKQYRVRSYEYNIDLEFDSYDEAMEVINDYQDLWPSDIDEEVLDDKAFRMDYRQVYKYYG